MNFEAYECSSAQRRLYMLRQIGGTTTAYNLPRVLHVTGKVDLHKFDESVQKLIQRHEALRTSFDFRDGEIIQKVFDDVEFQISYEEANEREYEEIIYGFIKPFDLSQAPLFRVKLVKIDKESHLLLFDMDHIITDGTSVGIFTTELISLYSGKELPPVEIQYVDFVMWQNDLLAGEEIKSQEEFWLNALTGEIPVLNMPTDYQRSSYISYEGSDIRFEVDEELTLKIKELTAKQGVTMFMFLLSVYNILLSKYSGQEDIIIGSPISGRQHAELRNTIGMFVNTLSLRNYPTGQKTFLEFLQEVKENSLKAYKNQDYQLEMLVDKLSMQRDVTRNPLFDVMFVFQNTDNYEIAVEGLKFVPYKFESKTASFDLTLEGHDQNNRLNFDLQFATKLFKKETIESLITHFKNILLKVTNHPEIQLSAIEMISVEEKQQILRDFNDTNVDYPKDKTIYNLFLEQVERTPDNIAVLCDDQELTYRELNEKANQLARLLRQKGVKTDDIVGIVVERSLEMILGIFGVLKAGAAYVPIAPEYPQDRIKYMLDDSGTEIILTRTSLQDKLDFTGEQILLDHVETFAGDKSNLENICASSDLIYVIYTSGSTGKPKGAMVEHRSVVNRLNWMQRKYPITQEHTILQKTPFTFDVSVWEIFWWSLQGAKVALLTPGGEKEPETIVKAIERYKITTIHFVPSMLNAFLEYVEILPTLKRLASLRQVFASGEALNLKQVDKFNYLLHKENGTTLHNLYGPTEATVDVTYFDCLPDDELNLIPIGKPIDNIQIYVLDRYQNFQPVGIPGELCIAGDGLARGYLNRPELTQEKFIGHPFKEGERIYRTGDLVRWLADGNIEFMGRLDHQIKIRGFRIELGEIELQLLRHPSIKEAIVMAREGANQDKYLCAYIVVEDQKTAMGMDENEFSELEIRAFLAKELPDYMIPVYFVRLDEMPLTANGKVNRKALKEPEKAEVEYMSPRNAKEEQMAEIWADVLGFERIGINENFFELRGDSIKAIQILARSNQVGINIAVKDIFKYKTILAILENVDSTREKDLISQDEVTGEVLLTPIQKWFIEQELRYKHFFNQIQLFYLKEDVDLMLLENVFKKVIEHHDGLRLGYSFADHKMSQFNRSIQEKDFKLVIVDLSTYTDTVQIEKLKFHCQTFQSNLDIEKDLLIKAVVFDMGKNGKRLFIMIHHLVVDGISWRILFEDIETLYGSNLNAELPLKTTSFKDWSEKLHIYSQTDENEVGYWEKIDHEKSNFPISDEFKEGSLQDYLTLPIELSEEETGKLLEKVNQAYNTGIDDILLSALTMAITEVMEIQNLCIILESHGREEIFAGVDVSRTIGWFTSAYPVCFNKKDEFEKMIKHVKETLRKIPNKGIHYGIARYLQDHQQLQRLNPVISFNYLGQFNDQHHNAENLLRICSEDVGGNKHIDEKGTYLIDINGMVINKKLQINITYNASSLSDEVVTGLQVLFEQRLKEIIEHCVQKTCRTYTPSDFGMQDWIGEDEFDHLAELVDLEDVKLYPLTPTQEGILFHTLLNPKGNNYFEQFCFFIEGTIESSVIKTAWRDVFNRHQVFRACYLWERLTKPIQIIQEKKEPEIYEYDISDMVVLEQENYLQKFKESDLQRKFDFVSGNLSRLSLVKLSDEKYFICWSFNHILLDGWSAANVIGDFIENYHSLINEVSLIEKPVRQFGDYLQWLKEKNKSSGHSFWLDYVKNFDTPTSLPCEDKTTKKNVISKSRIKEIVLSKSKAEVINNFCQANNITVNAFFQTALGVLLQKYNNTDESCLGMTVSGRPHELQDVESIVGLFINTLPVIIKNNNDTVKDLLQKVNDELIEIREYGYIPLADIQKMSNCSGPLFDLIIVFENYPISSVVAKEDLDFQLRIDSTYELTNYDFTMSITQGETIDLKLSYNEELFTPYLIDKIWSHLLNVIEVMVSEPEMLINSLCVVSEEEKKHLLYELNDTQRDYPKNMTVHQLFEEWVQKIPDQVAVICGEKQLTYKELNERSNQLARLLREKQVGPDHIVGIMVERSLEMVVGIMGIIKAGGAYLPIAPEYPQDRITYMLKDSGTTILLTKPEHIDKLNFSGEMIFLDHIPTYDSSNLENVNLSSDLMYLIYTSGSTGKPKGVMLEHRSVVNRLNWMQNKYPITKEDTILQKTPFTFDVSVWELFWWSLEGAKVSLLKPGGEKEPKTIVDTIEMHQITTMHFVPSMLNAFLYYIENLPTLEKLSSLRQVFASGEALSLKQVEKFNQLLYSQNGTTLHNLYGPTEASIDVTYFDCLPEKVEDVIPIGKPIDNTQLFIVDKHNNLQPLGIEGELCIAGDGLARGYLNRPKLTAEKFVAHPFIQGERIYRTGDLARRLSDGNIEFIGRLDHQVKVRGFRIELGEIEAQLLKHPVIKEAVVLMREDAKQENYLCAYIVLENRLSVSDIRTFLARELPEYMIPSYFIRMDQLPLTPNGKLDRKALPKSDQSIETGVKYVAPADEIEEKLVAIWSEILGSERIGINDNFFELGGHSLKTITLASRILKDFNREISLEKIFKTPTVKELAENIKNAEKRIYYAIEPVEERDYYPVSSAQKRLYVLNQLEQDNLSYNLSTIIVIENDLDKERLERAMLLLTKRHESLRTSFEVVEDQLVQKIHDEIDFTIQYYQAEESEVCDIITRFIRPFDLSTNPLFRVGLIGCADKQILMFDLHHIITDGISQDILFKEFVALYDGKELSDLQIQYKDFAVWQNKIMESENFIRQEEFWLDQFVEERTGREIPVLNLPTDFNRPLKQSFEGDHHRIEIGRDITKELNDLANQTETTLYMVLLAAYNVLLSKYSGQKDILVGTPIAGRSHLDLENVIGMFVNTLVLRNYPESQKSFSQFLFEVKTNAIAAFENQDYSFERLVDKLKLSRDMSRNPLFDTMFSLQNFHSSEVESKEFKCAPYEFEKKSSQLDLQLTGVQIDGEITFIFEYCTKIFKRETIQKMAEHFIRLLKSIVKTPEEKLSELVILSVEDKERLFVELNNTSMAGCTEKTIHQLFEEQVCRTPDQVALICNGRSLTYLELNERANQLANLLRTRGVQRETIVGIMAQRSLEMIIALFGVLKAGGAYLPIDPDYPLERIEYMLEDSQTKILLSQSSYENKINFNGEFICLDDQEIFNGENINLKNINKASDLIYMIYTSGSTGRPKGTMLEHCSVNNFIEGITQKIEFSAEKTILSLTTISFDIFVLETLLPLAKGAKVILAAELEQRDPKQMTELIVQNKVNMVQLTPSRLQLWLEDREAVKALTQIEEMLVGGEKFSEDLLERLQKLTTARIFNVYGPTETTVWSTMKELTTAKKVTIGRPIANTQVYILDNDQHLVPETVVGELYIAGAGLARGYYNRPELTEERFVKNIFGPGERMYKTGDLARWLPSGEIEFIGRRDQQVKIRGYRIETGEIQACLNSYADIKESVVAIESDGEDKYLVGYYVADREIGITDLRSHLAKSLPDYMVPSFYCYLESLPLTPNGKIDYKALPKINLIRSNLGNSYLAPETEIEKMIVELWQETLKVERIGVNDNFFELGGNSILLVQLHNKLEKLIPGQLTIADLFANPTIAKLSRYIEEDDEQIEIDQEQLNREREFWSKEMQEPWSLLELPRDYYQSQDSSSMAMHFTFDIKGTIFKKLQKMAFDEGIEVRDILATMYIYLFSQLSRQNDIIIEATLKGKMQKTFPLRINLEAVSNLADIFKLVNEKYHRAEEMRRYLVQYSFKEKNTDFEILPLFCYQSHIGLNKSDLSLKVKEEVEQISLMCNYNYAKLNNSKVKELIQSYVKLLEMLVAEYYN